jgi:hypothetical protein
MPTESLPERDCPACCWQGAAAECVFAETPGVLRCPCCLDWTQPIPPPPIRPLHEMLHSCLDEAKWALDDAHALFFQPENRNHPDWATMRAAFRQLEQYLYICRNQIPSPD